MPDRTILTKEQRDALFTKLSEDPNFRELMKKDWKEALSSMKIKPEVTAGGMLSRNEIESFAGQRASWTIEIVIAGKYPRKDVVELKETVSFDTR